MIKTYYQRVLAISAVLIFFTNLSTYHFVSETSLIPPYYWIILFGVIGLPLYFSGSFFRLAMQSLMVRWCYGFLMITGVWLLFQPLQSSKVVWQEFSIRLLSIVFMLLMLSVFSTEDAQRWTRRSILFVVLIVIALNIYELFNPLTFSLVLGRSAAFYRNPNQCGMALIIGMIFSIGVLPQRYRIIYSLLVALGVFLTFSRAAILGWSISMIAFLVTREISLKRSWLLGVGGTVILIFALIPWWDDLIYQLNNAGVLNSNVVARFEWFKNPTLSDSSASDRQQVLEVAWQKLADSPIVGQGVGASQNLLLVENDMEISSHNQYLNLMVDHGVMGLLILPLMIIALTWRARGEARQISRIFAAYILTLGFFTHNVFELRFIVMSFALMSAMVVTSMKDQANQQKTTLSGKQLNATSVPAAGEGYFRARASLGIRRAVERKGTSRNFRSGSWRRTSRLA
jgi:O-antigen ligase